MQPTPEQQAVIDCQKNCFVIARAGCVTGDTIIRFNRNGKGFKQSIEKAYHKFNNKPYPKERPWDTSKSTYVRSLMNGIIQLNLVEGIVQSGFREVYLLNLEDGKTLRATADHKVYTDRGWVELSKLGTDDYVWVDDLSKHDSKREEEKTESKKFVDKSFEVGPNHPYARSKTKGRSHLFYIEYHRAVYESKINHLSLQDYRKELSKDRPRLGHVDPKEYVIHHKDHNHCNNDPENLQMMTKKEHQEHHSPGYKNFQHGIPKKSRVVEVFNTEETEMTYDIQCKAPYHSFVANGMVIHNSGKTSTIVEKIRKIKEREPTSRILYITFTRFAREHGERKLDGLSRVTVTNYHSLCYRVLMDHKDVLKVNDLDIVPDSYCIRILRGIYGMKEKEARTAYEQIQRVKQKESNLADVSTALKNQYVALDNVVKQHKKFTYTDLILEANRLFRDKKLHPHVAKYLQYDYIFVDEQQDNYPGEFYFIENLLSLNPQCVITGVFDPAQCVAGGTKINGVPISDIQIGQEVISYDKGNLVTSKIIKKEKSDWDRGVKITTKSGKSLTMSPNHKIYATGFDFPDSKFIVYLMHSDHHGYRVGVTYKKTSRRKQGQGLASRMKLEGADRMWMLSVYETFEEARKAEIRVSLRYQVSTLPFNGSGRGMNQALVDSIFEEFGDNGSAVLDDYNLKFEFPHARKNTDSSKGRYVLTLNASESQGGMIYLDFLYSKELYDYLSKYGKVNEAKSKERRRCQVRFLRSRYEDASRLAWEIVNRSPVPMDFKETLAYPGRKKNRPVLTNASSLVPSMEVVSKDENNNHFLDEVVKVEVVSGEFFDIDIEDTHNFFGNGILSHNSIYGYAGATPEMCFDFIQKFDAEVFTLRSNFRSAESIIGTGNAFLRQVEEDLGDKVEMKAARKDRGEVWYHKSFNPFVQYQAVTRLMQGELLKKYKPSDVYVLFRTNKSGVMLEKEMIKANVPFKLVQGSFLNSKVVKMTIEVLKFLSNYEHGDDNAVFSYLNSMVEEMQDNIAGKTFQLIKDVETSYSMLYRLEHPDEFEIPGVGPVRKKSFRSFYLKLKKYISAYEKVKEDDDMEAFFKSVGDLLAELKFLKKANRAYFEDQMDDFEIFKEIFCELSGSFLDRVNQIMIDFKASDSEKDEDLVTGMSIHKAKGLENKVVVLVDFQDMPIPWTDNFAEEQRLAYVAVTRAEDRLYIFSGDMVPPMNEVVELSPHIQPLTHI